MKQELKTKLAQETAQVGGDDVPSAMAQSVPEIPSRPLPPPLRFPTEPSGTGTAEARAKADRTRSKIIKLDAAYRALLGG